MNTEGNFSDFLKQYNVHRQTIIDACDKSNILKSSLKVDLADSGQNAQTLLNEIEFSSLTKILENVRVCTKKPDPKTSEYRQMIVETFKRDDDSEVVYTADAVNSILKDLSLDNEIQEVKKPCIAVVGQTKAGKSSLVNCLLEKLVVSQAQTKATVRMTHLHHSKTKYIAEKKISDQSLQALHIRKQEKIPEEFLGVQTRGDQRSNLNIIGIEIHAGTESVLLEGGLKIVDSPGLNENKELNNLLKELMSSQLPLVIYVISGQKSLTEEDIKDIREMKEQNEDLQIIYFVTKLDMTKENKRDNPDKDPIEEANKRLQRVFDGLQKNGLLSSETTRENCIEFHGASLLDFMPTPRKSFCLSDSIDSQRFKRFRQCLFEKAEIYLYNNIMKTANDLSLVLQQTLHVIINHASQLDRNQETIREMQKTEIQDIRKAEKEIYETVKSRLSEENEKIRQDFITMLNKQEQRTEDLMKNFKYSTDLEQQLSKSAISKENIENCKKEINRAIAVALDSEIQYFVEHCIVPRETSNQDVLKTLIESGQLIGKTSLYKLLESRLIEKYELHEFETKQNLNKVKRMKKTMKKKLNKLKHLFDRQVVADNINPNSLEWKKQQALVFQIHFDAEKFADEYFETLASDLEENHKSFLDVLEKQDAVIKKDLNFSNKEKDLLKNYPAKFAGLYARSQDIIGSYTFPDSAIKQIDFLGRGGQGDVHKCSFNGEEIARKTCRYKNFESAALEIYFFSEFSHPNLQKLRGIRLNMDRRQLIQYLDLARFDCKDYLASDSPPLSKRVHLAIQICEAIKFIHSQGIMHRDLKLENVLIDHDYNAIVTDFGYCKPEAFATTLAGTPIHMSPEVIDQCASYKKSADIYSFGILLWYLIDATGNYPQYIQDDGIETPFQALDATKNGKRPEIKANIPSELGELMSKCWDHDPKKRPTIDEIIHTLENFQQSMPKET